MAISVTYGPITAAMNLSQQAGRGDRFWRRFAAEQQVRDQMNNEARTAIAARGQKASEALSYSRMAQAERDAQRQLAQRQAEFAGQQQFRQAAEQRAQEGFDLKKQLAPIEQERAERALSLQEQYYNRALQKDEATAEQKEAELTRKQRQQAFENQMQVLKQAQRRLEDMESFNENVQSDIAAPITAKQAAAEQVAEARQLYDAERERMEGLRQLPQYGQQAAQNVMQARESGDSGVSTQQMQQEYIQDVQTYANFVTQDRVIGTAMATGNTQRAEEMARAKVNALPIPPEQKQDVLAAVLQQIGA